MLQIKNLTALHSRDSHLLFENFSFALNDGDKAAVIGEEGNGKSTLLKLIYDPAIVEDYIEYSGEIVRGNSVLGYFAQELTPEEKEQSVMDFCFSAPGFGELSLAELSELCSDMGMDISLCWSDRKMETLSGGEKVKVRMAAMLAAKPDVLLLDEPSNDIDIETLEWLEGFINTCGKSILFISHDETLLENTANVIIHIEQLRRKTVSRTTVARLPYRQYVKERLSGFEHQEQMARSEERDFKKKMERFNRIREKVEHEQENISRCDPHGGRLLKKKMHTVQSMGRRFERESENMTQRPESEDAIFLRFGENAALPAGKTVVETEFTELFAGEKLLAKNINLSIRGGDKVCIIGRNGAGKTTLLRRIAEELLGRSDVRAAYMPQNYEEGLDLSENPVDFLAKKGDKEETTRIRTYLGSIKYTPEEMAHPVSDLSGGQKAKLFFAKMALGDYNVLILDEPTRNLSPLSGPAVRQVLSDFPGTIISVSHDRKYISEVCEKVYELSEKGLERVYLE
ncbi:MAG: ABC-F family ATP-binding cassette domain-containing protein [Oscillospiraceae bacterium]